MHRSTLKIIRNAPSNAQSPFRHGARAFAAAPLSPQEPIFGTGTRLALDSLDALQVSMALQKRYGVRLTDSKETRRILACVGNLADYLLQKRP